VSTIIGECIANVKKTNVEMIVPCKCKTQQLPDTHGGDPARIINLVDLGPWVAERVSRSPSRDERNHPGKEQVKSANA